MHSVLACPSAINQGFDSLELISLIALSRHSGIGYNKDCDIDRFMKGIFMCMQDQSVHVFTQTHGACMCYHAMKLHIPMTEH